MAKPKNNLKGLIISKYGTIKNYAKKYDACEQKVYNKVNGKVLINEEDMKMFCNTLNIPAQEIPFYFF